MFGHNAPPLPWQGPLPEQSLDHCSQEEQRVCLYHALQPVRLACKTLARLIGFRFIEDDKI
jgi:hypothetical protein